MITVTVYEQDAYVEAAVYGAYTDEGVTQVVQALSDLATRHDAIGELEIHHMRPTNTMSAIARWSGKSLNVEEMLRKWKRYAVVADDPPLVLRAVAALAKAGRMETRIFPMHEVEEARRWVAGKPSGRLSVPTSSP
ncbi:MAG: STAS/SEC14 domain-containing protein [Pseudomonadota bacterium]